MLWLFQFWCPSGLHFILHSPNHITWCEKKSSPLSGWALQGDNTGFITYCLFARTITISGFQQHLHSACRGKLYKLCNELHMVWKYNVKVLSVGQLSANVASFPLWSCVFAKNWISGLDQSCNICVTPECLVPTMWGSKQSWQISN